MLNINFILFCSIILVFLHFIGSLKSNAYNDLDALVSIWENSNMAGIVITSSSLFLITLIYNAKRLIPKYFIIILSILSVYLVFDTQNRGSMVTLIALFIWIIIRQKINKFINLVRFVLIISPIILVILYSSTIAIFPPDQLFLDKQLYVRPGWIIILTQIIKSPLNTNQIESGGLNMALAGVIEFGIFGIFAFFAFIISLKPKYTFQSNVQFQEIAYIAFLCIFIQQSFENTLINGVYGIYIQSYLLLGLANSNIPNNDVSENIVIN